MEQLVSHPSEAELVAFNHGGLDEALLDGVSHDLGDCPSCCGRLREISGGDRVQRWFRRVANSEETLPMPAPTGNSPVPSVPPIPGYEIEGVVGRGGMGVVYKARHRKLKRIVALKMVLAGGHAGPSELARFRIEAETVARLHHPNIVQIYEVGAADGYPYCALEFVDGGNLASKIDEKPMPPREAAQLMETLARAMQLAHSHNVVHRDLKPANILLTADGTPRITDFGLARQLDSDSGKTQAGTVMGSPSYMAPEQAAGLAHQAGPAADVYAMGAILYDCLTGQPPFKGSSVVETLDQVRAQEPVPPSRRHAGIPRDLDTICLKCLRKEPENRYPSAAELADELGRYLRGEPILARPASTLEKTIKWARREPAQAVAAAVSILALLTLMIGGAVFTNELRKERNDAQSARADTAKALAQAEKDLYRLETMQYVDHIVAADKAVKEYDLPTAQAHLDACRPDLRHIEYAYVRNQLSQKTGELLGHTDKVLCVALSADGKRLYSGSLDTTINVWDLEADKQLFTLRGHEGGVFRLALSADGKRLCSVSDDIKVWDAETLKELFTLRGHTDGVYGLALSSDGSRLYSGSRDKTIKVWDLEAGKEIRTLPGHTHGVQSLALSPDGKRLYAGGTDNDATIKMWDTQTLNELPTLPGHPQRGVASLAVSTDGKRLYSGSHDGTVKVWDLETGKESFTLRAVGYGEGAVTSLVSSADGKRLFAAGGNTIKIWTMEPGKENFTLRGHTEAVIGLALSPDGKRLYSVSREKAIKVWHLEPGKDSRILGMHRGHVGHLALSADGKRLVSGATSNGDVGIKVWDPETGTETAVLGNEHLTRSLALSADRKRLFVGREDHAIQVWNLDTNKDILTLRGHTGPAYSLALSADGKRLYSGLDKTIKVWDLAESKELFTLHGHSDPVVALTLSADGKRLFSGSYDKTIVVWDLEAGKELFTLRGHDKGITGLAVSPDGKRLYSGSGDQAIRIWDLETGLETLTLPGHKGGVCNLIPLSDGKRLFSAGNDKTIKLWDLEVGREILTLGGHFEWVTCLALSPDGKRLYSGSGDQTIRTWDLGDRQRP